MYENPYFDVNLLDNALTKPNIDLAIPLPHPIKPNSPSFKEMDDNSPVAKNFSILLNFIDFFSTVNTQEIYSHGEYYYFVNKFDNHFIKSLKTFMDNKLERDDQYLDELIYKLIDQELNLNLITSKQLPERFKEVKKFMVQYYQKENEKNLPKFHSSANFIRLCYVTVINVLYKMFPDGIWCNNLEVSRLYQQYIKDPMSIVYLPCHRSHVDYIILHILTVRFQLSTPVVIAGENLNVAIFGNILKKLGAIFIKRSFNNELYTERNLNNVLEFFSLRDIGMEVFIEGTRSRDGKLLLPKYGVLKMFREIYKSTKKDMLLQPVSISYERIYETDGYLKELIGKDKKQESFAGIIKNGVTNLFGGTVEHNVDKIINERLEYDNVPLKLNGRIFIKFGDNFKLSSFDDNLKKMGFTVFHEINNINYLPEISIVGTVIQIYSYLNPTVTRIPMSGLLKIWHPILKILQEEIHSKNESTRILIDRLLSMREEDIVYTIKYQIIKFMKFIKVDTKSDDVLVVNPIELLYYKNLTIHLLICKSVACFSIVNASKRNIKYLSNVNRTLKNLLKSEFLFDYNPKKRDDFAFIVNDLIESGKINKDMTINDREYLDLLASLVYPFLNSYMICVSNIIQLVGPHKYVSEERLIKDELLDFPDTKKLLKQIQKNSRSLDFESINKQYLLSCLYYLDHLELIKIFKNKSKTVAYVNIENQPDLDLLLKFFRNLFKQEKHELDMEHLVDVIEKRKPRSIKL